MKTLLETTMVYKEEIEAAIERLEALLESLDSMKAEVEFEYAEHINELKIKRDETIEAKFIAEGYLRDAEKTLLSLQETE